MMDNLFPVEKEKAWVNKQRTLLVCSKNISEKFQ
jgi:hypothetical protein